MNDPSSHRGQPSQHHGAQSNGTPDRSPPPSGRSRKRCRLQFPAVESKRKDDEGGNGVGSGRDAASPPPFVGSVSDAQLKSGENVNASEPVPLSSSSSPSCDRAGSSSNPHLTTPKQQQQPSSKRSGGIGGGGGGGGMGTDGNKSLHDFFSTTRKSSSKRRGGGAAATAASSAPPTLSAEAAVDEDAITAHVDAIASLRSGAVSSPARASRRRGVATGANTTPASSAQALDTGGGRGGDEDDARPVSPPPHRPSAPTPASSRAKSTSSVEEVGRLRESVTTLERLLADRDEQLRAVSNNQTMMQISLRASLTRRERELEDLKVESERRYAAAADTVERLVRDQSAREGRELRQRLASDGARLGRIVYTRAGMHTVESWERSRVESSEEEGGGAQGEEGGAGEEAEGSQESGREGSLFLCQGGGRRGQPGASGGRRHRDGLWGLL